MRLVVPLRYTYTEAHKRLDPQSLRVLRWESQTLVSYFETTKRDTSMLVMLIACRRSNHFWILGKKV